MKLQYLYIALISTILIFSSCEKEDPIIPNEEELITTLIYELIPVMGGDTVTLSFRDLDGDGGEAPIVNSGVLKAGLTYNGELILLNEAGSDIINISSEILEEDEEHQFFFDTTIADMSILYDDQDNNGDPIGLKTKLVTTAQNSGLITITLRHEPNKNGQGVAAGDITNAGGETDIQVTFPIDVE